MNSKRTDIKISIIIGCFLLLSVMNSFAGEAGIQNQTTDNNKQKPFIKLCNPDPSPEAVALFNYLQDINGKKILSGQMDSPWGIDELSYIRENTGKQPAILGMDFIHERDNNNEVNKAINWWKSGGIPTIMWHWGAPSLTEGYDNSKQKIDITKCFQEGTPEYISMWTELKKKADYLETLRNANVPVLWRPFHELNGHWFWYGKQGPDLFKQLWRTMYNYFVNDRKLNNLIWVLCYISEPNADWNPGEGYYDIAGADTYGVGSDPQFKMYKNVLKVTDKKSGPIAYHECGTPPDPDQCLKTGAMWSWWMEWHTSHLTKIDINYLMQVYNHNLIVTLDEVPDIMKTYGSSAIQKTKDN
jgi:hypothetical protein